MPKPLNRSHSHRGLVFSALALASGVLFSGLVACAPQVDATAAKESLSDLKDAPQTDPVVDEFDATLHPDPIVDPLDDCAPILVITARGTSEPTKGQLLEGVAKAIRKAHPDDTEVIDLDYPADTEVQHGGTQGVRTLIDTLNVQAEHCADQQFVLLGYSQGALVIGDALSSADTRLVGGATGSVTEQAASRISAIVFYGNPRFVGTEEYNEGDYDESFNGLLPRPVDALDAFSARVADYCVSNDFICQSGIVLEGDGELDEKGHIAYFKNGMRPLGVTFALSHLAPVPGEPAAPALEEGPAGDDAAAGDPAPESGDAQ